MLSAAITSTGMRQTQNLAAPPTQNTAPVLEYRCLFTHDVIRKQKRWQDGFLRFHTFNKRIMVYDSPARNYIGDKHWRQEGTLEDGDELQLEKPILVQVGEAVGSSNTDLTELLEKRRKPVETSPRNSAHTPMREPATTVESAMRIASPGGHLSQLRPKSLNALLGTPKGTMGRAMVPTKSPHQIRKENKVPDWESERPAKHQRTVARLESRSGCITKSPRQKPAAAPTHAINDKDPRGPKTFCRHQAELNPIQPVERITSNQDLSVPQGTDASRHHCSTAANDFPNAPTVRNRHEKDKGEGSTESARISTTPNKPKPQPRPRQTISNGHKDNGKLSNRSSTDSALRSQQSESVVEAIQILSDGKDEPSNGVPRGKVKLQIASRKPRKKLMYRDLLPPKPPPARHDSNSGLSTDSRSRKRSIPKTTSHGANIVLTDFHEDEQNQLADRLNRYNGKTMGRQPKLMGQRANSPSLFISDVGSDSESIDKTVLNHSIPGVAFTSEAPQHRSPQSGVAFERIVFDAPSTIHDTALVFSKMDEIMFSSSLHSRSFRSPSPQRLEEPVPDEDPQFPSSIPVAPPPPPPPLKPPDNPGANAPILVPSSPGSQPRPGHSPQHSVPEESSPSPETHPAQDQDPSHRDSLKEHSPKRPLCSATGLPGNQPKKSPTPDPQPPNPPCQSASNTKLTPSPWLSSLIPSSTRKPFISFTSPPNANENETANLSILQKPLPAFQAPRPKAIKPRSPLKKSTSDVTSLCSQQQGLPGRETVRMGVGVGKGMGEGKGEGGGIGGREGMRWTKEAWDLFGCGRDGVECNYEEFRRKEGLS